MMASGDDQWIDLFVYGSLLSGLSAHSLLTNCRFRGAVDTAPIYTLYKVGAYPGLGPGRSSIKGELYGVPSEKLTVLDQYEGVPHAYVRATIHLASGHPCLGYLIAPNLRPDAEPLLGTCWRQYLGTTI